METITDALILRKVPYSGTSVIASGYTRKHGNMSFMVRGLGKKRGNKLSALEPLSLVEVTFHHREKYDVQTVREITAKADSGNLFFDPVKGSIRLFLAEMLYKSLREESPDEELFDYIESSVEYLNSSTDHSNFHLIFLLKLTRFFGFFPKGKYSAQTPFFDLQDGTFTNDRNSSLHTASEGVSDGFSRLADADYSSGLKFGSGSKRNLLNAMVEYYRLHLEGFGEVKSLPILMEIFSA